MANILKTVFKSKRSKIVAAVVAVAVIAVGAMLYIRAQNAKILAVTLTNVTKGELMKSVTITGDIKTSTDNVISLSPAAKVVSVNASSGQSVKKGDILAVLDTADYQSQLKQAQINLSAAKSTLAYMTGASSKADRTSTQNAVSQAEIALENAESNYDAAERNLESIQQVDENAISQAEIALDNAEANYRAAKKNLDNLEGQLRDANNAVTNAQNAYNIANANYIANPNASTLQALNDATAALTAAQTAQAAAQAAYDSGIVAARQAVTNAENAVRSAEITLDNAQAKADSDYSAAEKAVSDAENAVRSAEIALSNARNTASFTASSDSEKIANQKAQISLLSAQIDSLNSKVEQGNLRANIDGTVTKIDAVAGQYPSTGDQIVVSGTAQYVVELQASQYDSVNIKLGQKASITVHGVNKQYEGTVIEMGQLAEKSLTSTDTDPKVNIKISITNPDANVVVGYQADADIILNEKKDALQVSFEAIQTEAGTGKKYVYVVDSGNIVRKTYVETGIETDYNVEVLSGLTEGQKCISNPDKSIKDGIKVRAS
jgi:multidrug efflux pump subunit AcrA (membrane-fusion protein)